MKDGCSTSQLILLQGWRIVMFIFSCWRDGAAHLHVQLLNFINHSVPRVVDLFVWATDSTTIEFSRNNDVIHVNSFAIPSNYSSERFISEKIGGKKMTTEAITQLRDTWRDDLLNNVMPFWWEVSLLVLPCCLPRAMYKNII